MNLLYRNVKDKKNYIIQKKNFSTKQNNLFLFIYSQIKQYSQLEIVSILWFIQQEKNLNNKRKNIQVLLDMDFKKIYW